MSRRSALRQAPTVPAPHRVPLVTTIQNRDESFDRDSRLVNAYAEQDPTNKEYWIEKRPGLSLYEQNVGNGYGMYNWKGVLYSVFGAKLYKNGAEIGTVDGTAKYTFAEMLGSGWLVLQNGVKAYYTDGTTVTEFSGYAPVLAGSLAVGSSYQIVSVGTSDFTTAGATNNTVGEVFVATGLGDPTTTGTVALMSTSLLTGVTYQIKTVGTTDFTSVGAAINQVNQIFTATGTAEGTGSVYVANFPANIVKGWCYLDGTLYVMDSSAKIWGTATLPYGGIGGLDDPRAWDPLNMLIARIEPDRGVALAKQHTYLVAFKEWTTEVFYNAGNATGSPLKAVQGAQSVYGCASADSIQDVDGELFWLTFNRKVGSQIARMADLRVQIISTPPIERLLGKVAFTGIFSWSFRHAGHRLYGLTFKAADLTLVYDLDQGLWYQWTDANGNYWKIVDSSFDVNNQHILQHETNGRLYRTEADYTYSNDDGEIVPVDIYTPNYDGGIDRRKHLHAMHFNTDQKAGSKLAIRFSDDDYQTWTNFREVNLANKRPVLTGCGTFYRRAWHFRHYANTPLRIKSVDLQMDLGTL